MCDAMREEPLGIVLKSSGDANALNGMRIEPLRCWDQPRAESLN